MVGFDPCFALGGVEVAALFVALARHAYAPISDGLLGHRVEGTVSNEEVRVESVAPRLLSTRTVAAMLGVSAWRVRALVKEGVLEPVRLGGEHGKLRFRVEDVERLIAGT